MIQFVFAEVFDFSFKSKELPPELDLVRALPALRNPIVAPGYEEKVYGQPDFTALTFPGLASVMSPKRRREFDLFRKLPSMFPNDRVVHPDAAASPKRCFAIKIYIW
jgi:hypothetical protein